MGEGDEPISLLGRLLQHAEATARFNVYFGAGRDAYDVRGRVAHESIFNINDGALPLPEQPAGLLAVHAPGRAAWPGSCAATPSSWSSSRACPRPPSRAWPTRPGRWRGSWRRRRPPPTSSSRTRRADGVPYWDTGAPGLARLGDYLGRPADPFNDHEPVDSSAAAIAAQGLIRLGNALVAGGDGEKGRGYRQAGLTVARTLFAEPYLSTDPDHEGLLLHSVYHRPNGWDHVPPGRKVPCGESACGATTTPASSRC